MAMLARDANERRESIVFKENSGMLHALKSLVQFYALAEALC
jgi:hypothetical protein